MTASNEHAGDDQPLAEKYAERRGPKFVAEYRTQIDRLITTYADEDARELLAQLRERFWDGSWFKVR